MFHNLNVFCASDKLKPQIEKLQISNPVQTEMTNLFTKAYNDFFNEAEDCLIFDGRYTPGKGEIQFIDNFTLPDEYLSAIQEPAITNKFVSNEEFKINSLFTGKNEGNESIILFQNFQKSQVITNRGMSIFMDKNTFKKIDRFAINIKDKLDCVFKNNKLYFKSYWIARQVLDLSEYYDEATEEDLHNFINKDIFYTSNEDAFYYNSDSWVRRKVALIDDSKVLERYKPSKIVEIAKEHNLELATNDHRLVIPERKKDLKKFLKFLGEDVYNGPLSKETFETNSKRQFNSN